MNNYRNLSIGVATIVALLCLFVCCFSLFAPTVEQAQNTPEQEYEMIWSAQQIPELPETVLKNVGPAPAGLQSGMHVRLVSDKAISETKEFYETEFQDRGWEYLSNSPPSRNHYTKEYQKENQLIQITATQNNADQRKTDIRINYRRLSNGASNRATQASRRKSAQSSGIDVQ